MVKPIRFNCGWAIIEPLYEELWFHAGKLWLNGVNATRLRTQLEPFTVVTVELSERWSCVISIQGMTTTNDTISWPYTAFQREMPIPPKGSGGLGIQK
jgi:hypothetical protein